MAIVPSYVSSSLLLMMMMLMVTWRASSAGPVRASNVERCQGCPSLFRNLLGNIRELLKSEDLRFGITSSSVVVSSKSNTLLACTPTPTQNTNCLIQRNSSFSETECMRNIMRDLDHYAAAIRSYLKAPIRSSEREEKLLSPTVEMIQDLRKCCSQSEEEDSSSQDSVASLWGSNSFSNRQKMWKMMRGFYTRAITINRAVGYIASGEHRK
ncbi:interleukin-12 subunit alpha isoform X2 [Takifugu rubripes]|nr:uncharacterized protein LOC101061955 isoform X2 [Takifugu rubripes]